MSVVLGAAAGAAGASAAPVGTSGFVEVSPCALWGDVLPVQLTRGGAREAIRCLVNGERAEAGLRQLDANRRLQRAAQRHTRALDGTGCFSHRCPGEPRLKRRLARYLAGSPRRYKFGEVIAWQPAALATPAGIVDQLMRSALHRSHVLHPAYEELGVGFTTGTPSSATSLGGIYTINFGMRVG